MQVTKPLYYVYYILSLVALIVAFFFERNDLIYIKPFTVVALLLLYLAYSGKEKSLWYVLTLLLSIVGEVFVIIDFIYYHKSILIMYAVYFIIIMYLIYKKNEGNNSPRNAFLYAFLFSLPLLFSFYSVLSVLLEEVEEQLIHMLVFSVVLFVYVLFSIYYYFKQKSRSNLWMYIASFNFVVVNILIGINELYIYDRMLTVLIVFCGLIAQFFMTLFMLDYQRKELKILER